MRGRKGGQFTQVARVLLRGLIIAALGTILTGSLVGAAGSSIELFDIAIRLFVGIALGSFSAGTQRHPRRARPARGRIGDACVNDIAGVKSRATMFWSLRCRVAAGSSARGRACRP